MTVLLYKEWNKVNFYVESGGDWNCGAGDTGNVRSHGRSLGWGLGDGGQPGPIG